jgi:hypothetical protein
MESQYGFMGRLMKPADIWRKSVEAEGTASAKAQGLKQSEGGK